MVTLTAKTRLLDLGTRPYREVWELQHRLHEAVRCAQSHGGTVVQAVHQIGEHGWRAIVIDSEGNRIALHSPRI